MTGDARRVAWIVGAGFSVPLGGPTLQQLLSKSSYESLKVRFADESGKQALLSPSAFTAIRLYHYGRRYPDGRF